VTTYQLLRVKRLNICVAFTELNFKVGRKFHLVLNKFFNINII